MKAAQQSECLQMAVADVESHMAVRSEQYTIQASEASSHIRKLEADLEKLRQTLKESAHSGGVGGGGYAVSAAGFQPPL